MADPPFDPGATNVTVIVLLPAATDWSVGADGVVKGVAITADELGDKPTEFFATTVIVYAVPLVSPVIVQWVTVDEQCRPPGLAVAV